MGLHDLLSEVEADARRQQSSERPSIVRLRIRWALTTGLIVALTMALTAAVIINRQYAAMMGQVIDYGASLANFLATESAEPTLLKEWVAIDASVKDIMEKQSFHEVTVVDLDGVVRVSSNDKLVGQPHAVPPGASAVARRADGVVVTRYDAPGHDTILEFEAPIAYKRNMEHVQLGRVHLGIPERPLSKVARLSMLSTVLLVLVTLAAVVIATYFMADRYFKEIRLLVGSSVGRRTGEFGQSDRTSDESAEPLKTEAVRQQEDPSRLATTEAVREAAWVNRAKLDDEELSPRWKSTLRLPNALSRHAPVWLSVVVVVVGGLLLVYLAMSWALNRASDPVYAALHDIPDKFAPAALSAPPRATGLPTLLQPDISAGNVSVTELGDRAIVRIRGDNLFQSGSASINAQYQPVLGRVADALRSTVGGIVVSGHTDDRRIFSARFPSNWDLSKARADAVVSMLAPALGDPGRVRAEGRADQEPIAPNDTPEHRALNRRVDITVFLPAAPAHPLTQPAKR
jgi:type VI secretion system peptidoglycan-associated protein